MTETSEAARGAEPDEAAGGNVDKIREIIFGGQMRDYERRFSVLEERLLKEASDLRGEMNRRMDVLEGFVKKEIELLLGRLKVEQADRADAVKELGLELKTATKTIEKRIATLDEVVSSGNRELRQQLLAQAKALSDDSQKRHQEITAALERRASQLQGDKIDREALAGMLTEVALRLKGEFKMPGNGK